MYVCMYIELILYLLFMIKFMLRWCICSLWRMLLPSGKLIGLLFYLLLPFLHYFFNFLNLTQVHTKASKECARSPCKGNNFSSLYRLIIGNRRISQVYWSFPMINVFIVYVAVP